MTKQIPLSKGMFALVDDEDYEYLMRWSWSISKKNGRIYAVRKEGSNPFLKTFLMHRIITNAPSGTEVDHRDGNGLNNTRSNLRVCSRAENSRNCRRYSTNTSGYKGVYWSKTEKKWIAMIGVDYKQYRIGGFATAEEAARAYDSEAKIHHGEYARLNFS